MSARFGAYWYRLCRKTPQLNDPTARMTISVESFRKEVEKAYKAGQADTKLPNGAMDDLMNRLFGRR